MRKGQKKWDNKTNGERRLHAEIYITSASPLLLDEDDEDSGGKVSHAQPHSGATMVADG